MYTYVICMKSGKEYKIIANLIYKELINEMMPKLTNEIKFSHFELLDCPEKNVAIIGSEISSIEYFIEMGK